MIYQVLEYYIKNYETIIHLPLGRVKAKKVNLFYRSFRKLYIYDRYDTSANRHKWDFCPLRHICWNFIKVIFENKYL